MKLINTMMALTTAILINISAIAQSNAPISELSLAENIATPIVPKKASLQIKQHMVQIKDKLATHYKDVEMMRNDDVIMVTIPCSDLFAPNGTELKESGKKYLRPFISMVKLPTMYKLLVAVYSDDTGEPEYRDMLTEHRADAIDEFFIAESGTDADGVIPYGMGSDDPLFLNDSMSHRSANRRVEIIIVPEAQMIDTARSGKLK